MAVVSGPMEATSDDVGAAVEAALGAPGGTLSAEMAGRLSPPQASRCSARTDGTKRKRTGRFHALELLQRGYQSATFVWGRDAQ